MSACLLLFAALSVAESSVLVRWGQIGCLVAVSATFSVSTGVVGGIVISEIYPQSIRGPASSLLNGIVGIFLIIFTLTFPLLLEYAGLPLIVLGYAAISVAGAIYLLRALPETKGKSLEAIDDYWSQRVGTAASKNQKHAGKSPPGGWGVSVPAVCVVQDSSRP